MARKLVYGVGVSEAGKFARTVIIDGKKQDTKEYKLWVGMLERCYSEKLHLKRPTYIRCTVSENFKNFQWFAEWCRNQIGFNQPNYHLDKDVLFKRNKVYSEHTCVFVPQEINCIFTKCNASRGQYPIGVHLYRPNGKFIAKYTEGAKRKHIGYYLTPEAAFLAYKSRKEKHIKNIAELYKDLVDERVYTALIRYVVEPDD